jgi:hypothetical protein
MRWEKSPKWTWKTDVRYHLYQLPLELLRALYGIATKDHVLNGMDWREYLDLAHGIADMKCGRWFTWLED